jgi:hypothetical protein
MTSTTVAPRTMPPASARSSELNPETAVEALTPDFAGVLADVATVDRFRHRRCSPTTWRRCAG